MKTIKANSAAPIAMSGGFIGGIMFGTAFGMLGMFLLDPVSGAYRRALIRDKTARSERQMLHFIDRHSRDLANRVRGSLTEIKRSLERENVSNERLEKRIRSQMGRAVSHPKLVEIECRNGDVTLSGIVLVDEIPGLYAAVRSVRGVRDVINKLQAAQGEREISYSSSVLGPRRDRNPDLEPSTAQNTETQLIEDHSAPSSPIAPTI